LIIVVNTQYFKDLPLNNTKAIFKSYVGDPIKPVGVINQGNTVALDKS
jgi:hypothetical protein